MNQIAKNEFYEIDVDDSKNRVYLKIMGFWKSPGEVPQYLADISTAADRVDPGFTVLTDLRNMKPPATAVGSLHVEAQQILVKAGLSSTAEIVGNAVLLEMQLKKYAQESAMTKAEFNSFEEAEAWLDAK